MAVCKYFLQGKCKFGDRCKFDHPRNDAASQNRFAALSNTGGNSLNSNRGNSTSRNNLPYSLDRDTISLDLGKERPIWILSAYGPGRDAPAQLFGGYPREQSFEEMRVEHYLAVAMGRPQEAINKAQGMVNDAESQMRVALNDLDGAVRYIANSQNEHPNRIDICKSSVSGPPATSQPNPFKQSTLSNGFSNSATVNGFGGQSQPTANATFGQPAGLGQQSSPFGQPSQLGQKPSPFGQPSQLGQTTSPFGQPSQLGQRQSAFGQPASSNPLQSSPFAQIPNRATAAANPFAQATSSSSPFGAVSQPSSANVFGNPSQPVTANAFGQPIDQAATSAFGAPSQPLANPFSTQNVSAPPSNPFGQPQHQTTGLSTFGSIPAQNNNPTPSTFGSFAQGASNSNIQAIGQGFGGSDNNPDPFPVDVLNPNAPGSSISHPDLRSYSTRDSSNKLTRWKSKPVTYIENEPYFEGVDGKPEKIWFPNGPPVYSVATEPLSEDLSPQDAEGHLYLREKGSFKDGIMPSVPPKRENCTWDF